jgi:hypothetical protein
MLGDKCIVISVADKHLNVQFIIYKKMYLRLLLGE